jgi:hypothetical protein
MRAIMAHLSDLRSGISERGGAARSGAHTGREIDLMLVPLDRRRLVGTAQTGQQHYSRSLEGKANPPAGGGVNVHRYVVSAPTAVK